ncbi:hypothetical protein H4219_005332 [Mycoemilia scoparia]|uniref:Uncharacterized protein n=1 Tax=Mycoemilia scoparia TaxID=417184 RepID=A0A9W7ZNE0_9FUNG|nr:hypothetical protein H4219_005332 [Mycoemilia scoparia]
MSSHCDKGIPSVLEKSNPKNNSEISYFDSQGQTNSNNSSKAMETYRQEIIRELTCVFQEPIFHDLYDQYLCQGNLNYSLDSHLSTPCASCHGNQKEPISAFVDTNVRNDVYQKLPKPQQSLSELENLAIYKNFTFKEIRDVLSQFKFTKKIDPMPASFFGTALMNLTPLELFDIAFARLPEVGYTIRNFGLPGDIAGTDCFFKLLYDAKTFYSKGIMPSIKLPPKFHSGYYYMYKKRRAINLASYYKHYVVSNTTLHFRDHSQSEITKDDNYDDRDGIRVKCAEHWYGRLQYFGAAYDRMCASLAAKTGHSNKEIISGTLKSVFIVNLILIEVAKKCCFLLSGQNMDGIHEIKWLNMYWKQFDDPNLNEFAQWYLPNSSNKFSIGGFIDDI